MQKYTILFLILLIFSCRHKKVAKIWEFPTRPNTEAFFFSYGARAGSDAEVNPNQPPSWGPSLKVTDNSICLRSQDDFFRSKEFGPSLGFCVEKTADNESLLRSALKTLSELDETKVRPDGFLSDEGTQAHLYFLSVTEIVNEISSSGSRAFFLGDNRLHTALEKRMDLNFENYKSVAGAKDHRIETSFSLPYFSIYTIDGAHKLIFPPLDSSIPRSQFHYLVLEFTKFPEFISAYQSNFSKIQSINDTWEASCSREKLQITETMGYASGSTKRFIEWAGSKDNPSCISMLSLSIGGKKISLDTNSPFLFPGAVKLFVEESSPLEGIVLKDANWKDIKSASKLELSAFDFTDSWDLPENVNFNWAEEEFSLKKGNTSCEWTSSIIRNANLCGDPGLELDGTFVPGSQANSSNPDNPNNPSSPAGLASNTNYCKPEDFTLTELNAFGLRPENRLDRTGKFIELSFLGANECKLSIMELLIGSVKVPFTIASKIVKPNSYWLITDGRHMTGVPNLVRRNLDFLQWQDTITLQTSTSSKILWKGLKAEDNFLSESMSKEVYSMHVNGEKFYHHREQKPNLLQAVYRVSHTMSPGEANNTNAPDASGELSEVLWAGGYKNSASLTEEKFVELRTKGDGTLELEIQMGTKLSRFYIPVSGLDAFTVLSKSNFQCFPNSRSIVSDKLSLSDDVTTLRLKADGKNLQEVKYFPLRDNGYNNTTQKIRASFSNSGINSIWRSSTKPLRISIAPDCQGQIFATPEASNEFEPFLADEIFDHQGNGRFYLAASVFDLNLPYSVKFYSHLPQEEAFLSLEKTGIASLLKPVVSILSTNGLFYQKLENYSDLKLYNRDGIFIEGIMTNPMNPQNEWILFCNRSKVNRDMADYEIEDEDSPDRIDSYFKRKKLNLPSGVSAPAFLGNSTNLSPGQCGYLVDPESSLLNLKPMGIAPTLVFTVRTTSTIGNGVSSGEALDLFKYIGTERIHVHSFGNRYSHAPFTIPVSTDEITLLQPGKRGEGKYDYEVLKW